MCQLSENLKLCTCNDVSEGDNWWALYRNNPEKQEIIMGELLLPNDFSPEDYKNEELLLSLLNAHQCFDFEYNPQNKDRLVLHFSQSQGGRFLYHSFEYKSKKWKVIEYHPLGWAMEYDELLNGKMKNLYK